MKYTLSLVCLTNRGRLRRENQDNYICGQLFREPNGPDTDRPSASMISSGSPYVYGIFDGMGGEECGEIASYLAAREAASVNLTENAPDALTDLCKRASAAVFEYQKNNELTSMGTTAALLHFGESDITLCNVGDSRIYRFSSGQLRQMSVDHTALAPFGRKAPLYQYLGMDPAESIVEPFICKDSYREGDIYLACSDGLTDMVTEADIAAIIAQKGIDGAQKLMDTALENGGKDNITILLVSVSGESKLKKIINKLLNKDTSEDKK